MDLNIPVNRRCPTRASVPTRTRSTRPTPTSTSTATASPSARSTAAWLDFSADGVRRSGRPRIAGEPELQRRPQPRRYPFAAPERRCSTTGCSDSGRATASLTDDERDADGDGLGNWDEQHGRFTETWWPARARRRDRAEGVEVPGDQLPRRRRLSATGSRLAGGRHRRRRRSLDGEDDQDHDGLSNQFEIRRPRRPGEADDGCAKPWAYVTRSTRASRSTPRAATRTCRSATTTRTRRRRSGPNPPGGYPAAGPRRPPAEPGAHTLISRVWAPCLSLHNRGRVPRPGPHGDRRGASGRARAEPRGHRPRPRSAPARPRARRAHEDREGPRRRGRRRAPRAHARQPRGAAGREPRLPQLGGADEPVAGRGRGRRGPPAAPGPRRPGRRPEVRPHRRAQRARARLGARDRRARGRRRARQGAAARARRERLLARDPHRRGRPRPSATSSRPEDFEGVDESPVRCLDAEASEAMVAEIDTARKANESLGGVFEVRAFGLVPGIGSHISWEERLDGRLAGAIMSIQAMKGVGIGDGFDLAGRGRLAGARRDLLVRGAGLLPRDQPRRRHRGRDDHRRPGRGARRDEAAADADQAAAQRRPGDQGAGRGAARAHRLVHGARGGRGRRGDGRAGAGGRATARSSAATTSTTSRPRCAPTRSASGGGAGSHQPGDRPGRVHGRGQVDRRPLAGRRAGRRRRSTPTASSSALGEPIESFFDREGEAAFRAREEEVVCELLGPRRRPGGRARRRRGPVRAGARRARAPHRRAPRDRPRRTPGGAPRARGGRSPATRALRGALARPRARSTSRSPTRSMPPADRDALRRALPFVRALADAPPGTRLVWAGAESGDYPVFLGPRADRGRLLPAAERAGASWSPTRTSRGVQRVEGDERIVVVPGEEHKTIHGAEHVLRSLAQGGAERGDLVRGGRRRRGRRPGRLLRGRLPARACATCRCRPRWWRRSTPPTAARPAWTCPRARTTPAPTTSPRRCCATRRRSTRCPAEEVAAGYAEVVKTALIAGGGLWARVRQGGAGGRTRDHGLRAHEARRGGRGRARRRAPPGAQPRPHGRATRSRPPPATRATATARRSASACWPRCACRAATRCAPRWPSCSAAHGLPLAVRGRRRPTTCWRWWSATRSAAGAACRSCSWRRPAR